MDAVYIFKKKRSTTTGLVVDSGMQGSIHILRTCRVIHPSLYISMEKALGYITLI